MKCSDLVCLLVWIFSGVVLIGCHSADSESTPATQVHRLSFKRHPEGKLWILNGIDQGLNEEGLAGVLAEVSEWKAGTTLEYELISLVDVRPAAPLFSREDNLIYPYQNLIDAWCRKYGVVTSGVPIPQVLSE